jgi:hypothetical protein
MDKKANNQFKANSESFLPNMEIFQSLMSKKIETVCIPSHFWNMKNQTTRKVLSKTWINTNFSEKI